MAKLNDLRVLGIEVENVKRLRVVRLKPGVGLIEVSGRNKQGKTSLLDCIDMAIGGGKKIPWAPIRNGEQTATIRLDLGNDDGLQLRLTRTFRRGEDGENVRTTLRVEDADGFQPKGAQTLLDSLMNGLTFDPEVFMRAKEDEQVLVLQGLVPSFDFATKAEERRRAFDNRTEENREAKRLQASADAVNVPAGTPTDAIDTGALVAELRAVGDKRAQIEMERRDREDWGRALDAAARIIAVNREEVARLRSAADALEIKTDEQERETAEKARELAALPPIPEAPDAARIEIQIAEAQETNRAVAALHDKARLAARAKQSADTVAAYSAEIAAIDKAVADAIGGADFPVTGLSIVEGRVMLRGVPFSQGSTAEQLRTSLAIGMAMNPRLRIIRIRQGAMFDEESWSIVAEAAVSEGFQIWAETISPHDANAIVMVDGEVSA